MNPPSTGETIGVACGQDDPRREAIAVLLGPAAAPRWYEPGELHELDRDVRRGRVRRVVFTSLSALLRGLWDEEIELDEWPREVPIEFVEQPEGRQAAESIHQSWHHWRAGHRRRQAIAGLVVSAVVLALSFLLCVVLVR